MYSKHKLKSALSMGVLICNLTCFSQDKRPREYGIQFGVLPVGQNDAITDVEGVLIGQLSVVEGESIRTGVTAILPHSDNLFQNKVPAAIYIGNGFGKLMGYSQVEELGYIETPIILTNTLSVPTVANAVITHVLSQAGNQDVRSVNAVVGETNDGYLNDIRARHIEEDHVISAIQMASDGPVQEGNIGAGTGTICFGFKGGIGTSSRVLPESLGGYTVGVIVQTNFGGVLSIDGVPVGEEMGKYYLRDQIENADGSCMIVVATDAPLGSRNLKRIAKRAIMGLAKSGGIASNGSGDYVIAFSSNPTVRQAYRSDDAIMQKSELRNDRMSPLFMATIEATEEAIINSLFAATTMTGRNDHTVEELPVERVLEIMMAYGLQKQKEEKRK